MRLPLPRRHEPLAWLTCGIVLAASDLPAQTIRGVVLDESSQEGVSGAVLSLVDSLGAVLQTTRSDADGAFTFDSPVPPGRYAVEVRRLGYKPTTMPEFEVPPGVRTLTLTVLVPVEPVLLEPVEVAGEAAPAVVPGLREFYERRNRAIGGYFLTPEDIAARGGTQLTHVLGSVPGVQIWRIGNREFVSMRRQPMRLAARGLGIRNQAREEGPACPVAIYVDGGRFRAGEAGINEVLLSEVAAIEVYRGASEVPAEFSGSDARCGVIAIWTKRAPNTP